MGKADCNYRALGIDVEFSEEEKKRLEEVMRNRDVDESNRHSLRYKHLDKGTFMRMGKEFVEEWGAPERLLQAVREAHPDGFWIKDECVTEYINGTVCKFIKNYGVEYE